jgi:hypothetical protein
MPSPFSDFPSRAPFRTYMALCVVCGNKRCPHATNRAYACTNSNEPGQAGSAYGPRIDATPPLPAPEPVAPPSLALREPSPLESIATFRHPSTGSAVPTPTSSEVALCRLLDELLASWSTRENSPFLATRRINARTAVEQMFSYRAAYYDGVFDDGARQIERHKHITEGLRLQVSSLVRELASSKLPVETSAIMEDLDSLVSLAESIGKSRQSSSYALHSSETLALVTLKTKVKSQITTLVQRTENPRLLPIAPSGSELPELLFPSTPRSVYRHPKLGELFDRVSLHMYAMKYAEGTAKVLAAAQPLQAPPTETTKPSAAFSECPFPYEAACSGLRYETAEACGDVSAIWLGGRRYPLQQAKSSTEAKDQQCPS